MPSQHHLDMFNQAVSTMPWKLPSIPESNRMGFKEYGREPWVHLGIFLGNQGGVLMEKEGLRNNWIA